MAVYARPTSFLPPGTVGPIYLFPVQPFALSILNLSSLVSCFYRHHHLRCSVLVWPGHLEFSVYATTVSWNPRKQVLKSKDRTDAATSSARVSYLACRSFQLQSWVRCSLVLFCFFFRPSKKNSAERFEGGKVRCEV